MAYRSHYNETLQAASGDAQRRPVAPMHAAAQHALPAPSPPRFLGALELPEGEDLGPPEGLTLDAAIEQLMRAGYDLRIKSFEIPQARADILTASLRANPMIFGTASSIPYAPYSPQRPGEVNFSATVIYPLDVSHKRRARTVVAVQAERVIEAQFQDAVRIDLDQLYMSFLDTIAARETVRYAMANRDGLARIAQLAQQQLKNQQLAQTDVDRIDIQLDSAEIGVEQAQVALHESKQSLALLLALPLETADEIQLRGSLRDDAPQPPPDDELVGLAYGSRPDLVAFRLGINRARADVQLSAAEKYTDVFLLWSPWELQNNSAIGGQNASSWSLAAFGSVPLFNRNQGNIRRAIERLADAQRTLCSRATREPGSTQGPGRVRSQPEGGRAAGKYRAAALATRARGSPAQSDGRRDQRAGIPGRPARAQRRGAAISRRADPAPPQHVAAKYRRRDAGVAVAQRRPSPAVRPSYSASRPGVAAPGCNRPWPGERGSGSCRCCRPRPCAGRRRIRLRCGLRSRCRRGTIR